MPDIILPNLGLELPDVGSDQDTWGDILNANLEILDNAVTYDAITKTLGAVDVTLTTAEAAHGVINLNGTLTANVNLIVPVSPVRLYLVNNGTTGAFTVTVKTPLGTGVIVNQGANTLVYSDGTNIVQGATSVNGSFAAGTVNAGTLNVSSAASFAAGTAALPSITRTGDLNTGVFFPAADTYAISTGGTERLTIDPAGNAGLGVTPSAWSAYKAIDISAQGSVASVSGQMSLFLNSYFDGSVFRYKANNNAAYLNLVSGGFIFNTAPSGTAGNAITFTQAMTFSQAANLSINTTATDIAKVFTVTTAAGLDNYRMADENTSVSPGIRAVGDAIVFKTLGSEAARITSAGNLLVGTTTDLGVRTVVAQSSGAPNNENIRLTFPSQGKVSFVSGNDNGAIGYDINALTFYNSSLNTERARITSGGYFKASNTGTYGGVAGAPSLAASANYVFQGDAQNVNVVNVLTNQTNSGGVGTFLPSGSVGTHYAGLLNNVQVYQVLANGNVQNTNNSYGAISDAKLKENVTDVSSYLDRFMQVRFRNFNFIGSDLKQFGVIAQELEQVFPSLVDETPDTEQVTKTRTVEVPAVTDEEGNEVTPATTREEEYTESVPTGTVTKSVKYSVLALMAGKVIQEQQAIIQKQQAQIDSILTRLAALEAK